MSDNTYSFDATPNSYFMGQDLGITRNSDSRTVLVNRKGKAWAVDVKAEYVMQQRELEVRTAAANLPEGILSGLEEQCKEFFWTEAEHLGVTHNFGSDIYQEGRSGGWAQVAATESLESNAPNDVAEGEDADVKAFIELAFDLDDLRLTAEKMFDDLILGANQELQVELSEYADWVGAEIQPLDGGAYQVEQLAVRNGRVILVFDGHTGIAFATEAKLVRKADGQVPARVTADPIMENVFRIIENRGEVSGGQLNAWLDTGQDYDPQTLYENYIAPAITRIEEEVKAS